MNVIIFVRVSTADQTMDRQVEELSQYAIDQQWSVAKVICEIGSGSTAMERRQAIDDLKRAVIDLKAGKVLVSEISRLGRTTSESLSLVDFLTANMISCFEYQRRIETLNADLTVNPIAELIMSVLASVAKMEKSQMVVRIKSGMASAVRKGKHIGRPIGSAKTPSQFLAEHRTIIKSLQAEKLSARKTAKLYSVSVGTVLKVQRLIQAI